MEAYVRMAVEILRQSCVAVGAHAYWKILKGEMEAAEMIGLRCAAAL